MKKFFLRRLLPFALVLCLVFGFGMFSVFADSSPITSLELPSTTDIIYSRSGTSADILLSGITSVSSSNTFVTAPASARPQEGLVYALGDWENDDTVLFSVPEGEILRFRITFYFRADDFKSQPLFEKSVVNSGDNALVHFVLNYDKSLSLDENLSRQISYSPLMDGNLIQPFVGSYANALAVSSAIASPTGGNVNVCSYDFQLTVPYNTNINNITCIFRSGSSSSSTFYPVGMAFNYLRVGGKLSIPSLDLDESVNANTQYDEYLNHYEDNLYAWDFESIRSMFSGISFAFVTMGNVIGSLCSKVPFLFPLLQFSALIGFFSFFLGIAGGIVGAVVGSWKEHNKSSSTYTESIIKRTKNADGSVTVRTTSHRKRL